MEEVAGDAGTGGLTTDQLVQGWHDLGVRPGMALMVHSSLSSLGRVTGGAGTVVDSLRTAVGPRGTVVVPAFTRQVADPDPDVVGVPSDDVRSRRDAVPLWHPDLPSSMGAIPDALRTLPESVRSTHPQASVAAVGAQAEHIVARQNLGFALGRDSPFGRLHDLEAHILLIGVGHNRNTFLHHAESLTLRPRMKVRRFPFMVDGERVWVETPDVGNDNDTYFPVIGQKFEQQTGTQTRMVGAAEGRLVPAPPFVSFAVHRLTELQTPAQPTIC